MPRLYVTNLHPRVNESDLKRLFGVFGNIRDITLKSGHAFLHFDDVRDAEHAFCHLNKKEMFGWRITIEHDQNPAERARQYAKLPARRARSTSSNDSFKNYKKCDQKHSKDGDRHHGSRKEPKRVFTNENVCNREGYGENKERYSPPIRTRWQISLENVPSEVSSQDLKDFIRPLAEISYCEAHMKRRGAATFCLSAKCDLKDVIRKIDGSKIPGARKRIAVTHVTESSQLRRRSPPRKSRSQSRGRSRSQSSRSTRSRSSRSWSSRSSSFTSSSRSRSKSRSRSRSASYFWTRSKSPRRTRSYEYA